MIRNLIFKRRNNFNLGSKCITGASLPVGRHRKKNCLGGNSFPLFKGIVRISTLRNVCLSLLHYSGVDGNPELHHIDILCQSLLHYTPLVLVKIFRLFLVGTSPAMLKGILAL